MSRTKGKEAIATMLTSQKNIDLIEKYVYTNYPDDYIKAIFESVNFLSNNKDLKRLSNIIKQKKLLWDCEDFEMIRIQQKERDDFLNNPIEVEEGVLVCARCGSNKTYSFSKQVRSCDEGTTVFARCANIKCGHKWKE